MAKIILTADKALFTDYRGIGALGFGLCLPCRLVPTFVEYFFLAPKAPTEDGIRARYAPYALAKVEASLLAEGFSRDEVIIVPPHAIRKAISEDTEIVGIHVVDPKGLAPVTWTLKALTGGGTSCTQYEFERLINEIELLKRKYKFKVVIGGPGAWQLRGYERVYDIDVLYEGEAEVTFPIIVKKLLAGEYVPKYVRGEPAPINRIPLIVTPSRGGAVQITRGCPRRCKFCSPAMWVFRSIPLEVIIKEVEFNLANGARGVSFITEDVLLYGAHGLNLNSDAVKKLFYEVHKVKARRGIEEPTSFSHVSVSSALVIKDAVKYISDIENLSSENPLFPQIGLESGSPNIVAKYFLGKPYPWKPEDWPELVVEASKLFNDVYWYPCYTYIIGFPDSRPEDYILTTELIDRLKDEGFIGWTFPLILIPIGGTRIEGEVGFINLAELPQEALDAIIAGWELSIKNSKILAYKLIRMRNPLLSRIVNYLVKLALNSMESWIRSIKERGLEALESFKGVNIRSPLSLTKTVISAGHHGLRKLLKKH